VLLWDAPRDFEEQPLQGMNGHRGEEEAASVSVEGGGGGGGVCRESVDAAATSTRSRLAVAFASVVWASTTYVVRLFTNRPQREQRFLKEGHRVRSCSSPLPCFSSTQRPCTLRVRPQRSSYCTALTRYWGGVSP